jgi:Flp pilus assembly protein TadG
MINFIQLAGSLARAPRLCGCLCSCVGRSWARNERGSISAITAISLAILLAFGALGVDVSLWLRAKSDAQGAADAAAGSAAAAAAAGNPASRLTAEGNAAAAANGFQNGMKGVTVTLNNPPSSGSYAGNANAYEVIISAPQQLYLASALPGVPAAPTVRGRAVALVSLGKPGPSFPTCILGLSPLANNVDVTFNGSTVVTANACDVDADSPSSSSINTNGGGSIHAKAVRTVGGVSGGNISVTDNPGIFTQQTSIPDPYAGRTIPSMPSFSGQNTWQNTVHNTGSGSPPVMAFNGDVTVKGSATLDPGIYIISNGSLNMAAGNSLTGTGVTIILTSPTPASDNGVFSIAGGASFTLSAPTTGPTAGIALWADARLPNKEDKFAGGSAGNTVGAIYLPSHNVKWAGNTDTTSKCMQLIAYNVVFTGSSKFNHNCDGLGTSDPTGAPTPASWTLVE